MIARHGSFELSLVERYRFEEELGHGAMGTVYRAYDLRLQRPVAIKLLHPSVTTELGVARFQSEIRIAANLHHPHIVAVHECGEADGCLFYVMDYLGGESLRDRLKREKQLSVDDALKITAEVADGLQHAHDHGVVHRDVKPENIILAEGRAYIVDFGLARAIGDVTAQRLTASGLSVGTPHYLSPEQASAEKDVGPKADQYALACVLYEMLVGEPPFSGPTVSAVAMRHMMEDPPSLRARRRSAPPALEAAVFRAMEKVPADRFTTVTEFAKAARCSSPGDARIESTPPSATRAQADPRVHRSWAKVALVLLAVLASGAAGKTMYNRRAGETPRVVEQQGIQVAVVPVIKAGSLAQPDSLVDAIAASVRRIGGMRSVTVAPLSVRDVGSPLDAARIAAAGKDVDAQYVAAIYMSSAATIRVDVLNARTGEEIASDASRSASQASIADIGWDIAVNIARSISARDSLFAPAYRALLRSTRSSRALKHMVDGQRLFGAGDEKAARDAYRRALDADSLCVLALHRLGAIALLELQFSEALRLAAIGVRRTSPDDARMGYLLRGQRYLALSWSDSAVAEFRAAVVDDPDNVDGWFGLAQAMYYGGWILGYSTRDAKGAYDQLMRLDSSFAQVHGEWLDVSLAAGDTTSARRALRHMNRDLPSRRGKELLAAYVQGDAKARDALLNNLDAETQYTLSELVLGFSRTLEDASAADRAARALLRDGRTPEARTRGLEYRLALAPALGREVEAVADVARARLDTGFDSWVAAAALAGMMSSHRQRLRVAAWKTLPSPLTERALVDPFAPPSMALEFLVQDALDEPAGTRAVRLMDSLRQVRFASDSASPSLENWRQSLQVRALLTRGDTARAVVTLRSLLLKTNAPYAAFHPLAALPMQRKLIAELLRLSGAPPARVDLVTSSFRRSWAIADGLFLTTSRR
ncbi:MAG: protein kinase [Gemmatimonadetes bacterium]|nr:protein kinase [Gemmatimonadota bacterium]